MSDSDFVLMRHPHPELADRDPVLVHASAFEVHALSGWVKVDTKSPEASASDESLPASGATTSKEDKK